MAGTEIPEAIRRLVRERARGRCEYCLTSEALSGVRCQVDHIAPRSRGGATDEDNLCLACLACNSHKHAREQAVDPQSGEAARLFHPRQQRWPEHFEWSADGLLIQGLTPTGRATVVALNLNDPLIVGARSIWSGLGLHPPPSIAEQL